MAPAKDSSVQDFMEQLLQAPLEKEGLRNYKVHISGGSENGDGYIGEITFVDVTGFDANNEEKSYGFVIKCGKKNKELRDMMAIRNAFENEIFFYDVVVPEFVKFQQEKGVDFGLRLPKCYHTFVGEDTEVLVLENLKKNGFEVHNRKQSMDRGHIVSVLKTYGKFHALSFALRDQKANVFKKMGDAFVDIINIIRNNTRHQQQFNMYEHIINLAKEEHEDEIVEKALLLNNRRSKPFQEPTVATENPYTAILHGDCWNNNFMFKYKDNNVSEVSLIDFQLSKVGSPVVDLSYFLFTCLSENDIKDFDELNNIYYETLSTSLRKLGSDPDKVFPFEELCKQWKKYSLFGLVMLPSIIRVCLSESDEVPDLGQAAETDQGFSTVFGKSIRNMDEYRKRTLPILKLAIKKGFV